LDRARWQAKPLPEKIRSNFQEIWDFLFAPENEELRKSLMKAGEREMKELKERKAAGEKDPKAFDWFEPGG
jgi:hypothetical protein